MGDTNSITGVHANVVYVCDMYKSSDKRDDQCEGLHKSIHRSLGFKKGMSAASLDINGIRAHTKSGNS